MILAFKTKANTCGHKKTIVFETANKVYTMENNFFSLTDFYEIKSADRLKIEKDLQEAGYTLLNCNDFRKLTGF